MVLVFNIILDNNHKIRI